jgi:glycerol-3-phosphate dehydrogenase
MAAVNIAIIGAGPYGLSLAAHLRHRGVEFRAFGQPMQFWFDIAGAGRERYLKSFGFATKSTLLETTSPLLAIAKYAASNPSSLVRFSTLQSTESGSKSRRFPRWSICSG